MSRINLLTDVRTLQSFLKKNGANSIVVDGVIGPKTISYCRLVLTALIGGSKFRQNSGINIGDATDQRLVTAVEQIMLERFLTPPETLGPIDGIAGPRTLWALEIYQNKIRDLPSPASLVKNPVPNRRDFGTQSTVRRIFGEPADEKNLVRVKTPYTLFLDWDLSSRADSFLCHRLVKESVEEALEGVLAHYGKETIHELGLDQFGGCYNPRKMRGGNSWSMHAWGIAIDWDADRNPLRSNSRTARFSVVQECHAFLDIWESVGWESLGREKNFDWMHVQAPRVDG